MVAPPSQDFLITRCGAWWGLRHSRDGTAFAGTATSGPQSAPISEGRGPAPHNAASRRLLQAITSLGTRALVYAPGSCGSFGLSTRVVIAIPGLRGAECLRHLRRRCQSRVHGQDCGNSPKAISNRRAWCHLRIVWPPPRSPRTRVHYGSIPLSDSPVVRTISIRRHIRPAV